MKILLSKEKIESLKQQLAELEKSYAMQQEEQLRRGGAADSWHETASFAPTQRAVESKLNELRSIVAAAKVLPSQVKSEKVILGSWVSLQDDRGEKTRYRLVHPIEAAPQKKLISIESPLGKALKHKKKGQKGEVNGREFCIIKVE